MSENNSKKYYEYRHLVTFDDTNSAGNVYFAQYFKWMGKCRELILAEYYPEIISDMKKGFGFATEFAHIDFAKECFLYDNILVRMTIADLTRTRVEFDFQFINEKDAGVVATGKQAVIWVNAGHHPSLMPDKLYNLSKEHFGYQNKND